MLNQKQYHPALGKLGIAEKQEEEQKEEAQNRSSSSLVLIVDYNSERKLNRTHGNRMKQSTAT